MKKLIILTILILTASSYSAFSVEIDLDLKVSLKNADGFFFNSLKFGVDPEATNFIDSDLGEFEIPNHPPNQLHAYFLLPTIDGGVGASYIDLRPNAETDTFSITYEFNVQLDFPPLTISWNQFPLEYIDSARIYDKLMGYTIDEDLTIPGSVEANISEPGRYSFLITIWFNKIATSAQFLKTKEIKLFPNPASEKISFSTESPVISAEVINMTGKTVVRSDSLGVEYLEISKLPRGIYFLKILQNDGKTVTRKFVKY